MADIDDELLALAGGGDSSEEETNAASKKRAQRPKAAASTAATTTTKQKKRKVAESSDEDAQGSDDEGGDDPPYHLEGIYKNNADKERIESLSLIDREQEIARRKDKLLEYDRRAQLAGLYAAQQGQSKSTAKKAAKARRRAARGESDMEEGSDEDEDEESEDEEDDYAAGPSSKSRKGRVRKTVGTSEARTSKLKELSENRKKKAADRRAGKGSDDDDYGGKGGRSVADLDDSDQESEESDAYVDSEEEAERRRARKSGVSARSRRQRDEGPFVPPTLEDLNRARIGRDDVLRIMYRKGWQDKLIGNFVRVVADPKRDERTGKMIPRYRAYEIVDWKEGPKWYQADQGKYTRVVLQLQFAREKHDKEISFISNSDITADEFQRYEYQAKESANRPSKQQILDQAEDWKDFINEPWTEDVVSQVLKAKKEAKEAAESASNSRFRPSAPAPSSHLNGRNGQSTPVGTDQRAKTENELLAELNERNRKADRERIFEAERKQAAIRRAAAANLAAAAAANNAAAAKEEEEGQNGTGSGRAAAHKNGATKAAEVEIDLGDF